jgi:hypothetical protein
MTDFLNTDLNNENVIINIAEIPKLLVDKDILISMEEGTNKSSDNKNSLDNFIQLLGENK